MPYLNATNKSGNYFCSLHKRHRGPHEAYVGHDLSSQHVVLEGGFWQDEVAGYDELMNERWERLW